MAHGIYAENLQCNLLPSSPAKFYLSPHTPGSYMARLFGRFLTRQLQPPGQHQIANQVAWVV